MTVCEPATAADLEAARKAWSGLQARFALAGYRLERLAGGAGFRVDRYPFSIDMPDLASVAQFAARAGIRIAERSA